MGKPKLTPGLRVREFPNQGLIVSNGKLTCSHCDSVLDHEKKSTVSDHCKGSKHKKGLEAATSTPSILNAFPSENYIDQQWSEMVEAFVEAGIPLNVFSNNSLRTWMTKYTKNGAHLPSVTTLRRKLEDLSSKDEERTVEICKNRDVCIIADETTDVLARKILNILVKPLGSMEKPRIVLTTIIEKCDANVIVSQVIKVIQVNLNLELNSLVVFCTDNAPYMVKAAQNLSAVCPRLIHSTCWAHVLHLVSEEIRSQMPEADELVTQMKRALIKAPARKADFLTSMEKFKDNPTLPPIPVLTRWTTWLEAAKFHWDHFAPTHDWVKNSTENSPVMSKLKKLFLSPANLAQQLERISQAFPGLSTIITELESESVVSSEVWSMFQLVYFYMQSLGIPSEKLDLYLKAKHPAIEFWQAVQILDPRKCPDNITSGLPTPLLKFSKKEIPFEELISYSVLSKEEIKLSPNIDVLNFWRKYAREMPSLSTLALSALTVPPSSADVERSFSYLKRILAPQRTSFTEHNLAAHIRICFNKTHFNVD